MRSTAKEDTYFNKWWQCPKNTVPARQGCMNMWICLKLLKCFSCIELCLSDSQLTTLAYPHTLLENYHFPS